jgi:hypothetical protein
LAGSTGEISAAGAVAAGGKSGGTEAGCGVEGASDRRPAHPERRPHGVRRLLLISCNSLEQSWRTALAIPRRSGLLVSDFMHLTRLECNSVPVPL